MTIIYNIYDPNSHVRIGRFDEDTEQIVFRDENDYDYSDSDEEDETRQEDERRRQREQQMERQIQINRRVAEAAQEEIIESVYPECVICSELLNNIDGPPEGIFRNCTQNCNDAVKVCVNGHIFHRGCILNSCNPNTRVDAAAQMGMEYHHNVGFKRKDKCPICQLELSFPCDTFKNTFLIKPVPDDKLKEYKISQENKYKTGGVKKRKTYRKKKSKKKRKTLSKLRKNKLTKRREKL